MAFPPYKQVQNRVNSYALGGAGRPPEVPRMHRAQELLRRFHPTKQVPNRVNIRHADLLHAFQAWYLVLFSYLKSGIGFCIQKKN